MTSLGVQNTQLIKAQNNNDWRLINKYNKKENKDNIFYTTESQRLSSYCWITMEKCVWKETLLIQGKLTEMIT